MSLTNLKSGMRAQIIDAIPVSGTVDEINFAGSQNDLLWVLFEEDDGSAWVGKFSFGFDSGHRRNKVEILSDGIVFVLAGGQGYFVNAQERRILLRIDYDNINDFLVIPTDRKTILATDGMCIVVLGLDIDSWKSERFSADGINLVSVKDGYLYGNFNDLTDEWADFSFDIQNKKFDCEQWLEFWRRPSHKISRWAQIKKVLVKLIGGKSRC